MINFLNNEGVNKELLSLIKSDQIIININTNIIIIIKFNLNLTLVLLAN